ncbi:mitochondrial thiamine pyrophosphate carrier-like [Sitophilus oryzae]|uniref:Mitochondrial thiamine pyrophosphate carrier n=1 Tax=Sitophilus oryzae TaxID=7048 RepID=A0A6J2YT06_SITOR|nr:mitochondrial thiamine pyrophosphate carrier-like [Sitophilus oryzae]XP_030765920.1 mitochondrial thiamine pyrophosphate carrier-like [Sitophilus oryzae]
MVGWSKSNEKLNQFDFAFAGGASGFLTRAVCQPLDVLKIRFQLQVEPISHHPQHASKYRSIFQAVELIFKEEGIKAFWKGHIPAQWLSISYGVAQFWAFEVLSRNAHALNYSPKMKPVVNFTCGSIAGSVATVVSFPFDVVRTRFVAQSEQKKVYHGMVAACKEICAKEGPIVLFRGLWPTVLQIGPHAGAQFMCYKLFDDLYRYIIKTENTTLSSSLFAGSLSGLCSKAFIYPFDLVKKRLQIQGFHHAREHFGQTFHCKGLTDCFLKIYHVEGFPGYFKGLSPSLIKAVCATALHFSSYEMVCKLLVISRDTH